MKGILYNSPSFKLRLWQYRHLYFAHRYEVQARELHLASWKFRRAYFVTKLFISNYLSNDNIDIGVSNGRGLAGVFCGLICSINPISVLSE